jgi:hypothetical protein
VYACPCIALVAKNLQDLDIVMCWKFNVCDALVVCTPDSLQRPLRQAPNIWHVWLFMSMWGWLLVIEDFSSAPKFLSCETRLCPFLSSVLVDVRSLQIGKFVEVTRPNLDTKHLGFVRGTKILILKRTTKVWNSLIISSLQGNIRLRSVSSYIHGVGMLMEYSKSLQAGLQMCRESGSGQVSCNEVH